MSLQFPAWGYNPWPMQNPYGGYGQYAGVTQSSQSVVINIGQQQPMWGQQSYRPQQPAWGQQPYQPNPGQWMQFMAMQQMQQMTSMLHLLMDRMLRNQRQPLPAQLDTPKYEGGKTARVWGDPHFVDFDGGNFDVQGEAGKVYNLLSDRDVQLNARFGVFNDAANGLTVLSEVGLQSGWDKLRLDRTGQAPTVNGQPMAIGQTVNLDKGGKATWDGNRLVVDTNEYTIGFDVVKGGSEVSSYINADFTIKEGGPYTDFIAPHGLLGQTADGGKRNDGKTGAGAQGEGAIEGIYTDYEVSGLFDNRFIHNRFGARIGSIRQDGGTVQEVRDIYGRSLYSVLDTIA